MTRHETVSGLWWFIQIAAVGLAALVTMGCWHLLKKYKLFCYFTIFSPEAARAATTSGLLRNMRGGTVSASALSYWIGLCPDGAGIRSALARHGGDVTTTMMAIGLLPRTAVGSPDWDTAVRESDAMQQRHLGRIVPMLMSILVVAGLYSFFSWDMTPFGALNPISLPLGFCGILSSGANWHPSIIFIFLTFQLLIKTVIFLIALHIILAFWRATSLLKGPSVDWPLAADRVSRALDRREDLSMALRGLQLHVGSAMKRCLDRALHSADTHPGRLLANAGVAPKRIASILAGTPMEHLSTVLRSNARSLESPMRHALLSQIGISVLFMLFLIMSQYYLISGLSPYVMNIYDTFISPPRIAMSLIGWGFSASVVCAILILLGCLLAALGQRWGWWSVLDGWPRLARGLMLRRLLAQRTSESELVTTLRSCSPALPKTLEVAAARGDLPGILAIAGWQVSSPRELDRAIDTYLIVHDRRRARFYLAARLLLPLVTAIPAGLTAIGIMLLLVQLEIGAGRHAMNFGGQGGNFSGYSAGSALLFWWTQRYEAEGEAALEQERANRKLPFQPIPWHPSAPSRKAP